MKLLVTIALGLAVLLMACGGSGNSGGDDERVLVLASGSYTEEEYRTNFRGNVINFPETMEGLCEEAERADGFESFFDVVDEVDASEEIQEPVPADRERAFEILKEECRR